MKEVNILDDTFLKNVLRCVKESKRTGEEIWHLYNKVYPPPWYRLDKRHGPSVQLREVESALTRLTEGGYLQKELTWFTDHALEKETFVYRLSNAGRSALISKKK